MLVAPKPIVVRVADYENPPNLPTTIGGRHHSQGCANHPEHSPPTDSPRAQNRVRPHYLRSPMNNSTTDALQCLSCRLTNPLVLILQCLLDRRGGRSGKRPQESQHLGRA